MAADWSQAMKASNPKTLRALILSLLLTASLAVLAGCSAQQAASSSPASGSSPQQEASSSADDESAQAPGEAPTTEQYEKVLNPTNVVSSFIGEKFYDQKVTNVDEALAAVKSAYDRIGADETVELEITAVRPTESGNSYYIFNQKAGDVFVHGASVKLIVDKNNDVIGLVSAVLPNVEMAKAEDWEITAEQAEQIVVKNCEENGYKDVKPEEGATEQTLIQVPNLSDRMQYAWVVYTTNYLGDSEMAYLAHYVDGNGTYLYAIPIQEPHNADAEAGDLANFDFTKFEENTWTGTVTLHDGTTKEVELPVLVDPSDNTVILADAKRKILCADFAAWRYDEKLEPRTSSDNSFDNVELLAYDSFINVWDFYASIGWSGPDGEGTPTLLLMDYVNANGEPEDNAFYSGRCNGFQVFAFNRLNPDGENIDVIAHEFTHCVTSTTMTTNLYLNDMGAINEGMSDVLGNLAEMIIVNKPETAWLIGDSSGAKTLRSMKDPHEFQQPEFRWDTYYAPTATIGTTTNDNGGVHTNSSLLNIVSYKLDQAGMPANDQFYFWMNVALAMTPHTDYAQMAELLPWCMVQSEYPQYVDALKAAIDEAGYTKLEEPTDIAAGSGMVSIEYDAPELNEKGLVRFSFVPKGSESSADTWPTSGSNKALCTLPAGDYACIATIGSADPHECATYIYMGDGWVEQTEDVEAPYFAVEEGKTLELATEGLPTTTEELGITDAAGAANSTDEAGSGDAANDAESDDAASSSASEQ